MSVRLLRRLAAVVLVVTVAWTGVAGAQDAQTPSTFPRPTVEPTVEGSGPDSTAGDLRFAQVGLIAVAVVGTAMLVAYWRHTGREARLRHRAATANPADPQAISATPATAAEVGWAPDGVHHTDDGPDEDEPVTIPVDHDDASRRTVGADRPPEGPRESAGESVDDDAGR